MGLYNGYIWDAAAKLEFLCETRRKASPASVCPFSGLVLKVLPITFFSNRCQDISWDIFWIGTSIWHCILRSCDLASLSAGWLILMRQAQQFAEQRYMLIRSYYWADSLLSLFILTSVDEAMWKHLNPRLLSRRHNLTFVWTTESCLYGNG